MSSPTIPRSQPEPSQPPVTGRVFKISLKGIPPVNDSQWAQLQAAARKPRSSSGRRYPEIAEGFEQFG